MQALWLLSLSYAVAAVAHPVYSSGNLEKRAISEEVFDDFFFYYKYASSADDLYCAYPNGNTLIEEFSNSTTDTQGFIARDDTRREIVVSLRGSTSVEDFAIDSETSLEPYVSPGVVPPPGAMTHTGFLTAWNSVAPGVISVVREQLLEHPGYAIVTTGHSLGGALSSLAGVSMKSNFPVKSPSECTHTDNRARATPLTHTSSTICLVPMRIDLSMQPTEFRRRYRRPRDTGTMGLNTGRTQTRRVLRIPRSARLTARTRHAQTPSLPPESTLITSSILVLWLVRLSALSRLDPISFGVHKHLPVIGVYGGAHTALVFWTVCKR